MTSSVTDNAIAAPPAAVSRQCFVIYCHDGSYWGLAYGERHRDIELEAVMIWTHQVGYARTYEAVTGAPRKSAEEVAAEVAKWQDAAERSLAARAQA